MDVAELGHYKEVSGNQECTVCPDWTTTHKEGTVSELAGNQVCTVCPDWTTTHGEGTVSQSWLVIRCVQSVLTGRPPLVMGQSLRMDVAEVGHVLPCRHLFEALFL